MFPVKNRLADDDNGFVTLVLIVIVAIAAYLILLYFFFWIMIGFSICVVAGLTFLEFGYWPLSVGLGLTGLASIAWGIWG